MLATTIRSPPKTEDYVPLAEYQSQTPESFADSKPVLHFHLQSAKASVPKSQRGLLAVFPADAASEAAVETDGAAALEEAVIEQSVDVFVNSQNFTIFSQQAEAGVSIPYPSISIHAVKQVAAEAADAPPIRAVWMQLELSDGGPDDDDFQTVELTITPPAGEAEGEASSASQLYDAIAACSVLHPDPNDDDDDDDDEEGDDDRIVFEGSAEHEAIDGFTGVLRGATDGSLPPPMPGSGGWITADNVHEYFDEEGNWIGPGAENEEGAEELGDGAGRTRGRDELDKDEVNGDGQADDPENKRPRVE